MTKQCKSTIAMKNGTRPEQKHRHVKAQAYMLPNASTHSELYAESGYKKATTDPTYKPIY